MNKTEIECCFPMCYDNVINSECEKSCPKNFYISESTGNIHCSPLGSIISDRKETENISSILCIHCDELCNRTIAESQSASGFAIIAVILAVISLLVSFIIVLVYLYHLMQRRRRKELQVNMLCTVPSTLYFVFHWCCLVPLLLLYILCFTGVLLYPSLYFIFCVSLVYCTLPSTLHFVFHWCCLVPFPQLSILCFTGVVLYRSLNLVFCVSLVLFCIVPST